MSPHKKLILALAGFVYALLMARLFFVALPEWLRQPDTVTNTLAIIAAFCWVACTIYAVSLYQARKKTNQKEDQSK